MLLRKGRRSSRRGRWRVRGARRLVVAVLVAVLTASVPPVRAGAAPMFVLLQMNLCNSGYAPCYTSGKAVDEAAARIRQYRPRLVTLQEVCRDDLYAARARGKLTQAMAGMYGSVDSLVVAFTPVRSRIAGEEYRRCRNGEQYGVAMIYHGDGRAVRRGWYTNQGRGGEIRTWTCATVIKRRLTACTTHLTINAEVAARQCHELMSVLSAPWMTPQVIISGDFNLGSVPAQNCTPAGLQRQSDDGVQQVLFTETLRWVQGRHEPMKWTDHPLLYERFRL